MKANLLGLFGRYITVGVLNTAVHWGAFFFLIGLVGLKASWANLVAFAIAVTCSFLLNANYTFKSTATKSRYLYFVAFMALLSFGLGKATEKLNLPPIAALISFSLLSLMLGFLFSHYVVFRNSGN